MPTVAMTTPRVGCQGYVTEIMLTLEAAVDNLDVDMRPLVPRDLFMSTPNLTKESMRSGAGASAGMNR